MLRVTPSLSAEGAKKYFGDNLELSDYYIDGQEIAGRWGGKAAKQLGLVGQVDQKSYFALCDNINPATGKQLTPRQKDNRRVGFDFTFSAPKQVSVLYELSGDERILDAFRKSVNDTMQDIEAEMKTRVRKGGKDENRTTGNMVWAEFVHFTSRPVDGVPDPHLHAHIYSFNLTHDDKEGRFKAGQFGDQKRDAPYFEAAFDARLAYRLNELGYRTERNPKYSFNMADLPQSITDKFSRRRDDIEAKAAEKGIASPEGKHAIGYYGREHKTLDQGKAELRQQWDARLSTEERDAIRKVIAGDGANGSTKSITPQQAMDYAVHHTFERASTISDKRLQAEALRHGVGSVLPEDVKGIAARDGMLSKEADGQLITTTQKTLDDEVAMLDFARNGHRKFPPLLPEAKIPADALGGLSEEQRKAAIHILTTRDTVTGLVGKAGTGKTTMMRATVDVIECESGKKVFTFAPSSQASRNVLVKEGFKNATTLETLLRNEKLQAQVKGQVIWVDEAGLISGVDMKRLTDVAKKAGSRLILSGDYSQHGSVAAGDAFRLLEQEAGVRLARLSEIHRQKHPGYKRAVEDIAKGSGKAAQKGFDALDSMGSIIESSGEERHRQLVGDYLKAMDDGKSALIIAPTHSEGKRLTDELRETLKTRGAIGKEREFITRRATGWTEAQKGDIRNYEPGMVIDFHEAVAGVRKRLNGERTTTGGFKKGEAVVVKGAQADSLLVLRKDGTEGVLSLDKPDRFQVARTRSEHIGKFDRIRITRNGEAKVQGDRTKAPASITAISIRSKGSPRRAIYACRTARYSPRTTGISQWVTSIPAIPHKVRR